MSKLPGFRGGWLLAGAAFALSILPVPRSQAEDAGNLYNTLVDIRHLRLYRRLRSRDRRTGMAHPHDFRPRRIRQRHLVRRFLGHRRFGHLDHRLLRRDPDPHPRRHRGRRGNARNHALGQSQRLLHPRPRDRRVPPRRHLRHRNLGFGARPPRQADSRARQGTDLRRRDGFAVDRRRHQLVFPGLQSGYRLVLRHFLRRRTGILQARRGLRGKRANSPPPKITLAALGLVQFGPNCAWNRYSRPSPTQVDCI